MAPRPIWKGYLKLSLVSCPVALYTAVSTAEKIALHLVNRKTGNRLRQHLIDSKTAEVVEDGAQAKGYEFSRGQHVILEEDDLDGIALESTHTVEIESFVPRNQVDGLYLDTPYYATPDDEVGAEAFAVIREAMKREEVVGLGRVVLYRRERIVMLEPRDRGIVATTLRYADEVRRADDYFNAILDTELPKEMLDLAVHIIKSKTANFDPRKFADRYEKALVELIKSKQSGKPPKGPKAPPPPANVVNLMDALRRSLGQGRAAGPP
jgi:DNA end-binding protein Ku